MLDYGVSTQHAGTLHDPGVSIANFPVEFCGHSDIQPGHLDNRYGVATMLRPEILEQ
jgi:hypothetical protein